MNKCSKMKKSLHRLTGYFHFTRRERKATSVLLLILTLTSGLRIFLRADESPPDSDPSFFELFEPDSLPSVPAALVAQNTPKTEDSLFVFDPNQASSAELSLLGLSERVIRTLVRYRERGGRFRSPEDLQKVYGLEIEQFERLRPFIRIEHQPVKAATKPPPLSPRESVQIDINQATAEQWRQLRGIGPVLSERIVKFRDKLGGFATIEQVGETWGLPDSTFQRIHSQLSWSPIFAPLRINEAEENELRQHPYLNYKQASVLIRYRENHGPFETPEDLSATGVIPDSTLQRLRPYLLFTTDGL